MFFLPASPLAVLGTQRVIFSSPCWEDCQAPSLPVCLFDLLHLKGMKGGIQRQAFKADVTLVRVPATSLLAQLGGWQRLSHDMFDTLPVNRKEEKKAHVYFAVTGQLWNVLAKAKHEPCSVGFQTSSPAQRWCKVSELQLHFPVFAWQPRKCRACP